MISLILVNDYTLYIIYLLLRFTSSVCRAMSEHLVKLSHAKGILHIKTLANVTKQEGSVPVFYWFYHTYWWQNFK
jgi:hypothetical protein